MNEFDFNVNDFFKDKLNRRFKDGGSGGSSGPPQSFPETADTRAAKGMMYPLVTNAIQGRGFGTDQSNRRSMMDRRGGLEESYNTARGEATSQMARTLRPEDTRVRSFVGSSLSRAYTTSKDDLERTMRAERVSDKQMGMDMASGMLANEQRLGVNAAESYNNALTQNMANASRMGTFQSNIASGAGEGLMDAYYANQMSRQ
jgi:hypothetical protein